MPETVAYRSIKIEFFLNISGFSFVIYFEQMIFSYCFYI